MYSYLKSLSNKSKGKFIYNLIVCIHNFMAAADSAVVLLELDDKQFNSAYLQYKFLICRKVPTNAFWLDKTYSCWSQVNMLFEKKRFIKKKKKSESDFHLGTPPRQARQAKKTSSSGKFIEVTHSRRSGRGRGSCIIIILLKLFFFKISDLVHKRTSAPVAAGNRAYMVQQTS